jgi:hypothetical protein
MNATCNTEDCAALATLCDLITSGTMEPAYSALRQHCRCLCTPLRDARNQPSVETLHTFWRPPNAVFPEPTPWPPGSVPLIISAGFDW